MGLNDLLFVVPAFLCAILISYISMPVIIKIAELKKLIDSPDGDRKIHNNIIPNLGGIGIFSAFIISISIWGKAAEMVSYPFFIASLFMLFLIGIKDDILVLSPFKKLAVQVTAAFLLVVGGGVMLTDFGGLFYLGQVPWIVGAGISVFIMVAIVNSYNLIDGIDGLAGGIGIIVSVILGIWFWGAGFLSLAVLSFALTGSLISFLMFNMHPAKIFMGDTGAMAVGFIIGFLAIEFISLNASIAGEGWHIANGQVFAIAILIVPIVDTLRVFTLRLVQGKHPFKADRNHTHHKLIDIGMKHHFASISLWLANIFVIGIGFMINHLQINIQLFLVMLLGFSILPSIRYIYLFSTKFIENRRSKREMEALYDTN